MYQQYYTCNYKGVHALPRQMSLCHYNKSHAYHVVYQRHLSSAIIIILVYIYTTSTGTYLYHQVTLVAYTECKQHIISMQSYTTRRIIHYLVRVIMFNFINQTLKCDMIQYAVIMLYIKGIKLYVNIQICDDFCMPGNSVVILKVYVLTTHRISLML